MCNGQGGRRIKMCNGQRGRRIQMCNAKQVSVSHDLYPITVRVRIRVKIRIPVGGPPQP